MADTYIKALPWLSSVITIQVRPNTDTYTSDDGTVTEPVDKIWTAVNNLTAASLTAVIGGSPESEVTDGDLAGLYISRVKVDGGDWLYSHPDVFTKPVAGSTITFTDGVTTVANGDTVDYEFLADGTGDDFDVLRSALEERLTGIENDQKRIIEAVDSPSLYTLLTGLGYTRD